MPERLDELTSIRAFAAGAICLQHVFVFVHDVDLLAAPEGFGLSVLYNLALGVDLFFILSGFILTHVYARQFRTESFRFGQFVANRLARIYPLHLFVIICFIIVFETAGAFGFLRSDAPPNDYDLLGANLLLVHAWGVTDNAAWNSPSWSISAEFFAYLLFPLLLIGLARLSARMALAVTVGAFLIAAPIAQAYGISITRLTNDFGIVRIFFEFCCGIALYFVFERYRPSRDMTNKMLLVCIAALVPMFGFQAPGVLIALQLGLIVYLVACLSTYKQSNILRNKALVYLGEISFATYMIHTLVLFVFSAIHVRLGSPGGSTLIAIDIAAVAVVYIGSAICFHVVEVPCRRFVRHGFDKMTSALSFSGGRP